MARTRKRRPSPGAGDGLASAGGVAATAGSDGVGVRVEALVGGEHPGVAGGHGLLQLL